MAITKTRTVSYINVYEASDSSADDTSNSKHPVLTVHYLHTFDDPDDDVLPAVSEESREITRYVEDGGAATDYSGEELLVRTVAAAIWT